MRGACSHSSPSSQPQLHREISSLNAERELFSFSKKADKLKFLFIADEKKLVANRMIELNSKSAMNDCFHQFDCNNKRYLDEKDFYNLVQSLVTGKTKLSVTELDQLFCLFDKNNDDKIDLEEFENVWNGWIKKLLKPVTALLVIDAQNDFIDGALAMRNCPAKQDANHIIPVINSLIEDFHFDVVVYSVDYHPEDHISFFENRNKYPLSDNCKGSIANVNLFDTITFAGPPEMEQKLWPKHCVQGTWGAELHPKLKVKEDSVMIHKGSKSNIESYSAFFDNMKLSQTELNSELQKRGVTHVFVCGIAYDYCVAFTALDSLELGYATIVVKDATAGTDFINMETKTREMEEHNAVIATSNELDDLMKGKVVRIEFAKVLKKHAG